MRSARYGFAACLTIALLGLPSAVSAQEAKGALDLVPEDAAFAFVVKNLAELRDKGDKFITASHLRIEKNQRPSALFNVLFTFLNCQKGLDEKGAAAVVFPNLKKMGLKTLDGQALFYVVFMVPISNLEKMAGNYGLKADDLKAGQLRAVRAGFGDNATVGVRGKHLYLGFREKAVEYMLKSKPVSGALSPVQRQAMTRADIAVEFGAQAWGDEWKGFLDGLNRELRDQDAADNQVFEQFIEAVGSVRFVVAGLRLEDGLGVNVIASFPKAEAGGAEAVKFLSALRGGPGASDLVGLPAVEPLIAYAAKGDGVRNVHMARALLKLALDKWLGIQVVLSAEERTKFWAAFDVMYQHLKGSRAVVYRTPAADAAKVGTAGAVAILDIDNTDAHMSRWATLVEVANSAGPKLLKAGRESTPKFTYQPRVETIDEVRVDVLTVEVPKLGGEVLREYQRLLGPDWNKLRMAVLGKQVVMLVGSDKERLRQTLSNLKAGARGLADNKTVTAALARLAPERKVELHVNVTDYAAFLEKARPAEDPKLSSFALSIEPDRIQLEVWTPAADVRAVLRALGMARD